MLNKTYKMNKSFCTLLTLIAFNLGCSSVVNTKVNADRTNGQVLVTKTANEEEFPKLEQHTDSAGKEVICDLSAGVERKICDLAGVDWEESQTESNEFKVTYVMEDLNDDGVKEIIVWVSSWSGTGGGNFLILSDTRADYEKLYETNYGAWSPIILSDSEMNGWSRVSYLQAGGGVEERFINLIYKNGKYVEAASSKNQPEGRVIIGKNWQHSPYGPLTTEN